MNPSGTVKADLIARRERAEKEGWSGEVDGLNLTLGHLRDKRDRAMRLQQQSSPALSRRPTLSERTS